MEELFIATVPALSVSTYGESREEVIEKVREAVLVTIEGLREIGQAVPLGDTGKVEVLELEV
jgi:predicted RNase H-like HicB family nuclease